MKSKYVNKFKKINLCKILHESAKRLKGVFCYEK